MDGMDGMDGMEAAGGAVRRMGKGGRGGGAICWRNNLADGKAFSKSPGARPFPNAKREPGAKSSHMKEADARIRINTLLENAGWRFFVDGRGQANIQATLARIWGEPSPAISDAGVPET